MHVASLSIFQSDLGKQIVNHVAEDELYAQVNHKLQKQSLEKKYEGCKLEEYGLLTYKEQNLYSKCSKFEEGCYG